MALRDVPLHGMEDVERAGDVVPLRVDRVLAAGHRVRRRGLLGVVDGRVGLELAEDAVDEARVLGDVADRDADLVPGHVVPDADAVAQRGHRLERRAVDLRLPLPLGEVVDDEDVVAELREVHRGRPAEVAVAAQDQDPHRAHSTGRPGALTFSENRLPPLCLALAPSADGGPKRPGGEP